MATYFGNNLGDLSAYRLQDQQQQLAAAADRRRDMTDMLRVNAAREQAQREQMARMYQTGAYRDVGMNDARVREAIGMGDINVRRQLGIGDQDVRREANRIQEQAGRAAWDLGLTPAQEAEFDIKRQELENRKNNPWLYAPPGIQNEMYQQKQLEGDAAKIASAANAKLAQLGAIPRVEEEMAHNMDVHGGFGILPTWGNRFGGMTDAMARQSASNIVHGTAVDPNYAGYRSVADARDLMDKKLKSLLGPEFAPHLADLVWDPVRQGYRSIHQPAAVRPPAGAPDPNAAAAAATNAALNTPLSGVPSNAPARGRVNRGITRLTWGPKGFTRTNVPPEDTGQ